MVWMAWEVDSRGLEANLIARTIVCVAADRCCDVVEFVIVCCSVRTRLSVVLFLSDIPKKPEPQIDQMVVRIP